MFYDYILRNEEYSNYVSETLVRACGNLRDKFLLSLFYETGMRIGKALPLWIKDIYISDMIIDLKDRGRLENNAEIKTVSSPGQTHENL